MKTQEMKVVSVGGSPRERGRAIGECLREDIRAMRASHRDEIEKRRGYHAEDYLAAFDEFGAFVQAAEKWAPDLLEEVWGMAEGAAISREDAFRAQLGDEDWFFDSYNYAPRARVQTKCTAFGVVVDEGLSYAGQNMDVPSYVEGRQALLRIKEPDSDLEALVFTYAGTMGLCGMNNAPLGVTCNTLMQLANRPDGLPVAFVLRSLLQKRSFKEAESFLRSVPHACGQNYIVTAIGRTASFECSPKKVVEYRPREDGSRVCHTNHPLVNDDIERFEELMTTNPTSGWVRGQANTCSRFSSVAARTVHRDAPIDLKELRAALRAKDDPAHPVCRDLSSNVNSSSIAYTAGSVIYELCATPALYLTAGPPTESDELMFEFSQSALGDPTQ